LCFRLRLIGVPWSFPRSILIDFYRSACSITRLTLSRLMHHYLRLPYANSKSSPYLLRLFQVSLFSMYEIEDVDITLAIMHHSLVTGHLVSSLFCSASISIGTPMPGVLKLHSSTLSPLRLRHLVVGCALCPSIS